MQSFTESVFCLECSECKANFSSASLLLQHFAQHVMERKPDPGSISDALDSSQYTHKDNEKGRESILESALRQASAHSLDGGLLSVESCSPSSSTISPICESGKEPSGSCRSSPSVSQHWTMPKNYKKDAALARVDLQTRLESCIMKLAAAKNVVCDSALDLSNSSSGKTQEDENSLVPHTYVDNIRRCASSRKQKNPKKVCCVPIKEQDQMDTSPLTEEKPTGKRRYPCSHCPKVFGWPTDLKRHILTHTGERPFKCRICDAAFTRNFLLQKHESRVHVDSSSLCAGDSGDDSFTIVDKKRKKANGDLSSHCNGVSCQV